MQTVCVNADINAVKNILDYFAECESNNCKIVTLETENGNADKNTEDTCKNCTDNDCNKHSEPLGFNAVEAHCLRRNNACESTDAHKACVTEAELTENTYGEIERNRHDNIGADGNKLTLKRVRDVASAYENLHNNIENDYRAIG